MFVEAVERVSAYTRAVHSIYKQYGSSDIRKGCATLFFVNETGAAVTCRHVVDMLLSNIDNYLAFKAEVVATQKLPNFEKQHLPRLKSQFGINSETLTAIRHSFVSGVDNSEYVFAQHPTEDLAILQFKNFKNKYYTGHAVFLKDTQAIKQGKSLCRLGFPFPEFTNYQNSTTTDDVEWTTEGQIATPIFPMDGIVTRHIANSEGHITGIELSTPGLRGQSGGPLFDTTGLVYGMQSSTKHLHLGFDLIGEEITLNGRPTKVTDYQFMNVGQCVHAQVIKKYLDDCQIKYYQA